MDTNGTVRVGVIGAGRIGKIHAGNLATRIPGARVTTIADIKPDVAKATADKLGIPRVTADYRDILADPEIDAVAICSSTTTHPQIVMDASRAKKHIFCEKPLAADLGELDRALAAVEASGVKLQVGFNRRFDPNFRKVRDMVAAGQIGEPQLVRVTSRDPEPPPPEFVKTSGGIFLDMTIHDFDMARYLMGRSEVDEVYVAGAVLVDPRIGEAGDIDTAVTTLQFANGAIATIDNCRKSSFGYDQRVEVFGSEGMVQAFNNAPDNVVLSNSVSISTTKPLYFFLERYAESFLIEMREFIECVREDKAPLVSGLDCRMPILIGMAARKSYQEHRPVRLREFA
jgi:myo-inositol 2-dehydrogenase/D-chiro-inositol 1-dehydrogenase